MEDPNIPILTDDQRKQLLERQFQTAMAGSEALLIHLGKAYLDQRDHLHHTIDAIPMAEKSYEQLLEALEDRQRQIPDETLVAELGQTMALMKAK